MHALARTEVAAAPAALEAVLVAAWSRRRPAWTRTDSARWVNDRSPGALAWLRRTAPRQAPAYSRHMGYWLKEHGQAAFSRIHQRLAAATAAAREGMTLEDVL